MRMELPIDHERPAWPVSVGDLARRRPAARRNGESDAFIVDWALPREQNSRSRDRTGARFDRCRPARVVVKRGRLTSVTSGEEPMLALVAAWRGIACCGCGQRPEDLTGLDAISIILSIQLRSASLLLHPEESLRHRRAEPGSWSAMQPAAQVANVLNDANNRLRDLLGEDRRERAPLPVAVAARSLRPAADVLATLAESVRRLATTIVGATAEDWYRAWADGCPTAGEMVWLALHDATHLLEDAELLLDAANANGTLAWTADGHSAR